jgi:hypothetical protein
MQSPNTVQFVAVREVSAAAVAVGMHLIAPSHNRDCTKSQPIQHCGWRMSPAGCMEMLTQLRKAVFAAALHWH